MFTITFNDKKYHQWIAKYKKPDGKWATKFIPKVDPVSKQSLGAGCGYEAERWFITWLAGEMKGVEVVDIGAKTLAFYGPKWLEQRDKDAGSPNYYKSLSSNMNCWILDNKDYEHFSIERLDLEKDFTVPIVRKWIESLGGEDSSKGMIIGVLATFFRDMIGEGSLSEDLVNPFSKEPIKKIRRELRDSKDRDHVITILSQEQVLVLLTGAGKIPDYRRMRYVVSVCTGIRDGELNALTWDDVKLEGIPYLDISKQLLKPGCLPALHWENLRKQKKSRKEILSLPNAIFKEPKFNSKRQAPLPPLAVAALRWWKKRWLQWVGRAPVGSDAVFCRENKVPGVAGYFATCGSAELFRNDLEALGLPTVYEGKALVFHSLRHSMSSMLEGAGVGEEHIAILLGHKAVSTTRKAYLGKNLAMFAEFVCRLPLPVSCRMAFGNVVIPDKLSTVDSISTKEAAANDVKSA